MSELESKKLLSAAGVPFLPEVNLHRDGSSSDAGRGLTFPVVAKLNGDKIAHKTERGLVRLNLKDPAALDDAVGQLFAAALPEDGRSEEHTSELQSH